VTQAELRDKLETAVLEELDRLDMSGLADMLEDGYNQSSKGLMIASDDARHALDEAFRKISRLAVRTGYIPKEEK
jgi:hypothetical protein